MTVKRETMAGRETAAPDSTAVRVALWRAMHVQIDPPPHVLEDEVDQPGPQAWKRQRLIDLGYGVPDWLRLVPTDFEAGEPWLEASARGAQAAGTPFISFYTPAEMLAAAREAGFADVRHVPGTSLAGRYFADRADGLRPSSGEDLLVAVT